MLSLTTLILTFNERLHIRRCVENVLRVSEKVYVIDCHSTDGTQEICREYPNVEVVEHDWPGNQAEQFNWALDTLNITTDWVLRIDADEYLDDCLIDRLLKELPTVEEQYTGIKFLRTHTFLGKFIKGGTGLVPFVRLFRTGQAHSDSNIMDEQIIVENGSTLLWKETFCDDNLNDLGWWTQKHNNYSLREAAQLLDAEYGLSDAGDMRKDKRKYAKLPLFLRAFAYFIYRYFFRLGFLEGKEGFLWCFLQGWWYRTLVDAKIYEIKKVCGGDKEKIKEYLRERGVIF